VLAALYSLGDYGYSFMLEAAARRIGSTENAVPSLGIDL
jgi:hypothetical protein